MSIESNGTCAGVWPRFTTLLADIVLMHLRVVNTKGGRAGLIGDLVAGTRVVRQSEAIGRQEVA